MKRTKLQKYSFHLTLYVGFFSAAVTCFLLHSYFAVSLVLAASIPALLASFIPFNKAYQHHPYAAIYTGCFAGMCSASVLQSLWELAIISLIGTVLYIKSMSLFAGFGGRLGGIAFICVACFVALKEGLM